jgi:hypothetical protein
LVALRIRPSKPAEAAALLGVTPELLRPRISRWRKEDALARLTRRDGAGRYHLTALGARRADAVAIELNVAFDRLRRV